MKNARIIILIVAIILAAFGWGTSPVLAGEAIVLPPPSLKGTMSVEEAIALRRSFRDFRDEALTRQELSQLLWAGQGITAANGKWRATPSAGAIYPMTLYVFSAEGLFRYDAPSHCLMPLGKEDRRAELAAALAAGREHAKAPLLVVVVADVKKTGKVYKDRAKRYCDLEAGHIAQNMALQAASLNMGLATIGAFRDKEIRKLLNLPEDQRICYVLPIGHR